LIISVTYVTIPIYGCYYKVGDRQMAVKDMFVTISEAAKILNVSRQTIYRWIEDKKFPAEKVGGMILVDKKSVLEFRAKRIDESFFGYIIDSLDTFIRREFKYSREDEIGKAGVEDECLIYVVNKKNGKSDKIKIGGLEVTFAFGKDTSKSDIRRVKFEDTAVTHNINVEGKGAKGKDE
jgi:excisionase family DNA binding protein